MDWQKFWSEFEYCGVCGCQHHPANSACDGLRTTVPVPVVASDGPLLIVTKEETTADRPNKTVYRSAWALSSTEANRLVQAAIDEPVSQDTHLKITIREWA